MGIFAHSSRSALVRSDTDDGQKAWLAVSALIYPKGVLSGGGQDSVQARSPDGEGLHCSWVQWRRALHHCIRCFALHLVMYGLDAVTMETHSMKLSTHCSWANLKATWSLEVCSDWLCRKLATSAHYAPQHLPAVILCGVTTSWLSCHRFQSLPLCYNHTDSWLWNI